MSELTYEYEEQPLSVFEADAVEYRILDLQEKLKRERETHRRTREQLTSMMIQRDRGKLQVKQFEDLTQRLS